VSLEDLFIETVGEEGPGASLANKKVPTAPPALPGESRKPH
jgi:hypothetical protein